MTGKNYTVMELAEQIGVPRTTINDWLSRYSQYIETVAQGKRKVYPESAMNVLREIAALRNAGKAFTEIETELAAKHPIRAVPVTEPEEKKTEEKQQPADRPAGDAAAKADNNFAIQPRERAEEIGRLIGDSFRNMDQRIQELEKLSRMQRRTSFFWMGICLLFVIILAGGSYLAWHFHELARKENLVLQRQQQENEGKMAVLREQSAALTAGNKAFQENIVQLKSDLARQKKEFEQNIQEEKKRLTELHQAQKKSLLSERDQARMQVRQQELSLALEKEKFAAERLKMLREMDELKKQQEALAKENSKLKQAAETSAKPAAPPAPAKPEKPVETKKAQDPGKPVPAPKNQSAEKKP